MTQASRHTGLQGEKIAQSILKRKGFQMEALNWRSGRLGEIDIIAYHPGERLLVFVEVKARKGIDHGRPDESVHAAKQAQLTALAEAYLGQHPPQADVSCRFDVIAVLFPGDGKPAEIQHYEDAFGCAG